MKIVEFYEPREDKETLRSEDDTRKSKLTLAVLVFLRSICQYVYTNIPTGRHSKTLKYIKPNIK